MRKLKTSGYLEALNKPNVTAVWDGLASVTKDHVVTTSGEHYDRPIIWAPAQSITGKTFTPDVLALATGFDTVCTSVFQTHTS